MKEGLKSGAKQAASAPYDAGSIALHWLSAALVLAAIALIESKGWFPKGDGARDAVRLGHFHVGLLVLLATVLRLIWRPFGTRPAVLAADAGSRSPRAAAAVHGLLYLALLALPLSGLMILLAAGQPVSLFGWPLPVAADGGRAAAKGVKTVHELLGNALIALVAVHLAAALWHHVVRRDQTLVRMLPRRRAP